MPSRGIFFLKKKKKPFNKDCFFRKYFLSKGTDGWTSRNDLSVFLKTRPAFFNATVFGQNTLCFLWTGS